MADEVKVGGMNIGTKEIIFAIITLAIALSGWFIPAPEPMTEIGMRCLTVFVAMVVGWTLSAGAWPSLMGLLLFPATGVFTFSEFLGTGWGSDTLFFMIAAFVLVGYLKESGISQWMVNWLMTRKFLEGHPWRLVTMILVAAYIICSLVNFLVGLFLMWEIVYGITRNIGQKPYDKFPSLMVFGIAMQCAFSLVTFPWSMNAIANLGVYATVTGEAANMLRYMLFMIPFGALEIAAYVLLCKFVFRLDVGPLKGVTMDMLNPEDSILTPDRKRAGLLLILFIIMLLLPSFFPAESAFRQFYGRFGTTGIIVLFFVIACLIYTKDGRKVVDFAKLAATNVPWNMVLMVAVILAIGACLRSELTGIAPFLAQNIVPIMTSVPGIAAIIVFLCVETVLTNFLINMVVVAMFLPVFMPAAAGLGTSPELLAFLIMLTSTNAILTPAGCAAAAMLFPNKEWMRTSDIYKYGVPTVIVNIVVLFVWFLICNMTGIWA